MTMATSAALAASTAEEAPYERRTHRKSKPVEQARLLALEARSVPSRRRLSESATYSWATMTTSALAAW
jgi:hypothetical protein